MSTIISGTLFAAPNVNCTAVWEDKISLRIEIGAIEYANLARQVEILIFRQSQQRQQEDQGQAAAAAAAAAAASLNKAQRRVISVSGEKVIYCTIDNLKQKTSESTTATATTSQQQQPQQDAEGAASRVVTLHIRLLTEAGDGGAATVLEQSLLPLVALEQCKVARRVLDVRWFFPPPFSCSSPGMGVVDKYELCVSLDQQPAELPSVVLLREDDPDIRGSSGRYQLQLPEFSCRSQMALVKMRCYSSTYDEWSAWSAVHRMYVLEDVVTTITAVNDSAVTIKWGRFELEDGGDEQRASRDGKHAGGGGGGMALFSPNTELHENDLKIHDFSVFAWKAVRRTARPTVREQSAKKKKVAAAEGEEKVEDEENPTIIKVIAPHLHTTSSNLTVVHGLEADSVYNIKVQFRNHPSCPFVDKRFFRVATASLPRFVQIPRVGTSFMDVVWHVPPKGDNQNLDNYVDDDRSIGFTPTECAPGESYQVGPPYTHVRDASVRPVPLLYRFRILKRQELFKNVDVRHCTSSIGQEQRDHQKTRLDGLEPGVSYTIAVKCASVSQQEDAVGPRFSEDDDDNHAVVVVGDGEEKKKKRKGGEESRQLTVCSQWGQYGKSLIVTTVHELDVQIENRGSSFFDISWSLPQIPRVLSLHTEPILTAREATLRDVSSTEVTYVEPTLVVTAIEEVGECNDEEAQQEEEEESSPPFVSKISPRAFERGELDPKRLQLQTFGFSAMGVAKYMCLQPNKRHCISVLVRDTEERWHELQTIFASTLPRSQAVGVSSMDATTATTNAAAAAAEPLQIDERFHLELQELPRVGATNQGRMLYEVGLESKRRAELHLIATSGKAKIGNLAMLLEPLTLGTDHLVLGWKAVRVSDGTRCIDEAAAKAKKTGGVNVAGGDDDDGEGEDSDADKFNRSAQLVEYRVKVQSEHLFGASSSDAVAATTTTKAIAVVKNAAETAEGKDEQDEEKEQLPQQGTRTISSRNDELYFRCCTRRTRIVGLVCERKYTVSLSMFDNRSSQWTPWSKALVFTPAKSVAPLLHHVGVSGFQVAWRLTSLSSRTLPDAIPSVVNIFVVRTVNLLTGEQQEETVPGKVTSHTLRTLDRAVFEVTVQACYKYDTVSPQSPPLYVAVVELKLMLRYTGQFIVAISWPPPRFGERFASTSAGSSDAEQLHQQQTGKIILLIEEKDISTADDDGDDDGDDSNDEHFLSGSPGSALLHAAKAKKKQQQDASPASSKRGKQSSPQSKRRKGTTTTTVELPLHTTHYEFQQAHPNRRYVVRGIAVREIKFHKQQQSNATCGGVGGRGAIVELGLSNYVASPPLDVVTPPPIDASLDQIGENFAIVKWPRMRIATAGYPGYSSTFFAAAGTSSSCCSRRSTAMGTTTAESEALFGGSFAGMTKRSSQATTAVPGAPPSTSQRGATTLAAAAAAGTTNLLAQATRQERYLITVEDVVAATSFTLHVTPSSTSRVSSIFKHIPNLRCGAAYRVFVQRQMTSQGEFDARSTKSCAFFTLPRMQFCCHRVESELRFLGLSRLVQSGEEEKEVPVKGRVEVCVTEVQRVPTNARPKKGGHLFIFSGIIPARQEEETNEKKKKEEQEEKKVDREEPQEEEESKQVEQTALLVVSNVPSDAAKKLTVKTREQQSDGSWGAWTAIVC